MSKQMIKSAKLAPPVGPFSPAVRIDGLVYLSGQVGQDPSTGKIVEGGSNGRPSKSSPVSGPFWKRPALPSPTSSASVSF